jgi:glycerol kinase
MSWDDELFKLFGLNIAHLPDCRRSDAAFGHTDPALFGGAIALVGVLGDQQASLLGHGCLDPTDMKVTIGTGSFIWANIGSKAARPTPAGIIRTVAWQRDRTCYAEEGFASCGGSTLDWLAQRFSVDGSQLKLHEEAAAAADSAGLLFVPAVQGLGAPWWRPDIRAAILGLSETTTTGHIGHAALEAICYQMRALLEAMLPAGARPGALRVDGGVTRSRYLLQLLADILGLPIHSNHEASALAGTAIMAGIGAGIWTSLDQPSGLFQHVATVSPNPDKASVIDRNYRRWVSAVVMLIASEDGGGG